MDNKILPVPKTILEKILRPVSKLTESCILKICKDDLYTVCTPSDNSLILYAKTKLPFEVEDSKLNIINIKKFLTGLDCLGDNGEFSILLNSNNIECRSMDVDTGENTYFKYHLMDDGIIKESTVNVQKISKLNFDTEFEIKLDKVKKIVSAYSFVDVTKIYFFSDNGKINCEINDRTMQNVDNMSMVLSDIVIGEEIVRPIPVNIEVFKNLISSKKNIKVKLNNEYKVFVFQTQEDDNVELKYIVSALVK